MFTFKTKEKCQKERTVLFFLQLAEISRDSLMRLRHHSQTQYDYWSYWSMGVKMPNILITLEGTSFTNSANINGHE